MKFGKSTIFSAKLKANETSILQLLIFEPVKLVTKNLLHYK